MQRTVLFSGVFLGAMALTSAWSNQASERLVSEDIWHRVKASLREANRPQPHIDFSQVMNCMDVVRDDDGKLSLRTGIVVSLAEVDACLSALAEAIAASNRVAVGDPDDGAVACAELEILARGSNSFQIHLLEAVTTAARRTDKSEGLRLAA